MKYTNYSKGVTAALLCLGSSLLGQMPLTIEPGPVVATTPVIASTPLPSGGTDLPRSPLYPTVDTPRTANLDAPLASGAVTAPPDSISSWLAYPRSPICCGPVGKHGPIFSEIYTRAGVSVPLGVSRFTNDMNAGFTFTVGSRALLFNSATTNAWVFDFGITNTWWSITNAPSFDLINVTLPAGSQGLPPTQGDQTVTPIFMHAITLDLSVGKEHYLWGSAACDGTSKCRIGYDLGGRYGTSRLDLVALRHRKDAVGGFFTAAHLDMECPYGSCMFYTGARIEYGYLFNDILQRFNDTDLQTINVVFS
ncbi:MAG: hypothetical protein EBV06_07050, partial [Planctomycetia bacterium]|nr:hypothetical protein [Planctomycetia bacterium]